MRSMRVYGKEGMWGGTNNNERNLLWEKHPKIHAYMKGFKLSHHVWEGYAPTKHFMAPSKTFSSRKMLYLAIVDQRDPIDTPKHRKPLPRLSILDKTLLLKILHLTWKNQAGSQLKVSPLLIMRLESTLHATRREK